MTVHPDSITLVVAQCPLCGDSAAVPVGTAAYQSWRAGTLVQNAFPDLSRADRERLITGICGTCWDDLWGDDA